ncbi:uncharacterized protein B0I36DRAFT_368120 [Microdochium trichocladiopsis]|uniref:Uncharacterized protein n=1 Tax=Microdochium trichocladiopsis TaxID=1682393 RepID=A0A9P8XX25_9PEZI|nr:uncharacterized protein B0I36DRAFT_368120 [Microdochium trichocladiopsis]KAH7018072.1 hypothetical protein B0I36DRAFT_368120 [Microdochium trichocladiopsis]
MLRAQVSHPYPVPAMAAAIPKSAPPPRLVPALVFGAAGSLVVYYVQRQLRRTSGDFDRAFAQYNTPESEASRARAFAGAVEDPRTSFFNALGWRR